MAEGYVLTDDQIQGYIDDRLKERDRAAVAAYLLANPAAAAEVETLRRQSEALKGVGQEVLDEPVPERLRNVLDQQNQGNVVSLNEVRRRRASPFLEAAAAVLLFCVGGGVGWFINDQVNPPLNPADMIASDLAGVFAFYGAARDYPIDFPPDRSEEFATWIGRSFEREIPPPDLSEFAYKYGGGRLLPAAGIRTGFFQFYGPDDARIAVFFWPAERPPQSILELGRQENISARYWFGDGLSFAVMSDEANPDLERAAESVFAFFEEKLGSS
jgi:anti-sigma factor RsiW